MIAGFHPLWFWFSPYVSSFSMNSCYFIGKIVTFDQEKLFHFAATNNKFAFPQQEEVVIIENCQLYWISSNLFVCQTPNFSLFQLRGKPFIKHHLFPLSQIAKKGLFVSCFRGKWLGGSAKASKQEREDKNNAKPTRLAQPIFWGSSKEFFVLQRQRPTHR